MRRTTRDFFLMVVVFGTLLWMFPLLTPWLLRQDGELTRIGWGLIIQSVLLAIAGGLVGGLGRVDPGHHRASDAMLVGVFGVGISLSLFSLQVPVMILVLFATVAAFTSPVGVIALLAALIVAWFGWRLVYRMSARSFRFVFRCVARMICDGVPLWATITGTVGLVVCAVCVVCLDKPPVDEIMIVLLVAGMVLFVEGLETPAHAT